MSVPAPVLNPQVATTLQQLSVCQVPFYGPAGSDRYTVPYNILERVFKFHWDPFAVESTDIIDLAQSSRGLSRLFRPLMYRHVNLRTLRDSVCFFTTTAAAGNTSLAGVVKTLQLSFDLDPGAHSIDTLPSQFTWPNFLGAILRQHVPLEQSEDSGDLAETLPKTVQTLHLKPLPEDTYTEIEDPDDAGPWDDPSWRLSISLIPHIHTLIVPSPLYIAEFFDCHQNEHF
ncbi:hypothetical protein C8R47DRAFT_1231092 [Mycena vitilis]|nr:hypothetical protein C8R47DRAFT_1231092 [Mycena vitilis]